MSKKYNDQILEEIEPLILPNTIDKNIGYLGGFEFSFLNINHTFKYPIDWNYSDYGKLWTYNLNYFDFLNQPDIDQTEALLLINDFIDRSMELEDGLEPYPISLRGINWIKYLSEKKIRDKKINTSLFNQYMRLLDNLEYHILGNHLLENGMSLLFGAYYFKNDVLYLKAKKIIEIELNEQVLYDGAHFELSPMYHQIILDRLLDCITLLENNFWKKNTALLSFMKVKATLMLSWLTKITFSNGNIPMVNDSAYGIAPNTSAIETYGDTLEIHSHDMKLSDSGYRIFKDDSYELFIDVGEVGPMYQPGHAHADTFSFVLHQQKPLIVDPGLSTYNQGEVREEQRSTYSHNTVTLHNENSSEVWAGFRVANRARVTILRDEENTLIASHNGYKKKGVKHTRSFDINEKEICIKDFLNNAEGQAHFHFHPDCNVQVSSLKSEVQIEDVKMSFDGAHKIEQYSYRFSNGYNNRIEGLKITVTFTNLLETKIKV